MPTTTRTRKQYRRINLPGPRARVRDLRQRRPSAGRRRDRPRLARARRGAASPTSAHPLAEVREHLPQTADPAWLRKQRVAEDLFAYLVVERELLPEDWVKELAAWAENRGWTVSLQGRKIYAVPKPLTKSAAVREVARRTGADLTLAAGDSLLDADLLLAADRGWRPGHGELADAGWTAPADHRAAGAGCAAGERILREFLRTARTPQ